jgi:hypothetical protein
VRLGRAALLAGVRQPDPGLGGASPDPVRASGGTGRQTLFVAPAATAATEPLAAFDLNSLHRDFTALSSRGHIRLPHSTSDRLAATRTGGVVTNSDPQLLMLVAHYADGALLVTVRPERPDVRIVRSDPHADGDVVITVTDVAATTALLDLARRLTAYADPSGTPAPSS